MRRLLAAALAAASLSASAALERVGTLQFAEMPELGEAIGKLGLFIGNPLATAGMAALFADLPTIKHFGPMRPKSTMVFAIFLDGKEFDANPAAALDGFEAGLLYPIVISKDEFVKRHAGAFETNGVVVVTGGLFGGSSRNYVAFSPDGKWIGTSDHAEAAKLMLEAIPVAEKSLDGDIVRLQLGEKVFKAGCAAARAGMEGETLGPSLSVFESCRSFLVGLRVSDFGVDVRGAVRFAEGSEAALCGQKPLGERPLAFAGKGAVCASAQAEDCGNGQQGASKMWDELTALLKKHGVDVSAFLARAQTSGVDAFTLDAAALVKFFDSGESDKAIKGFDAEKFLADAQAIKSEPFAAKAPAYASMFGVKGFSSEWTVEDRFAATLPEAAGKTPFSVSFFSFSSIVKAAASHVLARVPEEQRSVLKPVVDQFATESKRGIASMCWAHNGAQKFFCRVSADEIRSIGGLLSTALMLGTEETTTVPANVDIDDEN